MLAQIIFLDEPTTGVDPQSRRLLWEELQRIKGDRVVILTTHSMVFFFCNPSTASFPGLVLCLRIIADWCS